MKRIEIAAAFAGALAWTVLQTTTAPAQAIAPNGNILVDYMEPLEPSMYLNMRPDDPRYKDDYKKFRAEYDRLNDVHERLQRRQLLEELSQFLSPLRLPVNLRLVARQCMGSNVINAFFSPSDRSITLCYQYVRYFEELYDKLERRKANFAGIGRGEALTGTIVSTMLHETGHAVFSLLQVPVLGREEDASDQIAAYVMLQFGKPVARTAVRGTAWKWYSKDWNIPCCGTCTRRRKSAFVAMPVLRMAAIPRCSRISYSRASFRRHGQSIASRNTNKPSRRSRIR